MPWLTISVSWMRTRDLFAIANLVVVVCWSLSLSLSLSLRFNGHFPGEPGLTGVYWSKGWRRWWWQLDYWSYKSCFASQIITTNKPTSSFLTDRMPFLSPNQQCQSTERKNITFHGLAYSKLVWGVFQLCLWPLTAPGYIGGGLSYLSSALWCQYPTVATYFYCWVKKQQQKKLIKIWHIVGIGAILLGDQEREIETGFTCWAQSWCQLHQVLNDNEDR